MKFHSLSTKDMTPAQHQAADEWRRSAEIARALEQDSSTVPASSDTPVYAEVNGVTVDIASAAYANWYAHYYGSSDW